MPKPFHLAWFTNFTAGNWDGVTEQGIFFGLAGNLNR
jgi:hypothetical protein